MSTNNVPLYVQKILSKLVEVRSTRSGWDAICPCPDHNKNGDQHASLHIEVAKDGRILVKCRVGCQTDAVLDVLGLDWSDLFSPDGQEVASADSVDQAADPTTPVEKADTEFCHRAYEMLLKQLSLSDDHRDDLRRRGLSDTEIERRQYRTLRNMDRGGAAKAVHEQLGDAILTVPGFVKGEFGVTLHGEATGILVPVRDLECHIVALKIRRATAPKYLYLSGGAEGASPGSPVHVPLGVSAPCPVVRVTEGELKADVCMVLDSKPTIGVPGVTQWQPAIPVLRTMESKTVILAFDSPDVHNKAPVFEQVEAFWIELRNKGFIVDLEEWYAHV